LREEGRGNKKSRDGILSNLLRGSVWYIIKEIALSDVSSAANDKKIK
jgi:hypothetical protein